MSGSGVVWLDCLRLSSPAHASDRASRVGLQFGIVAGPPEPFRIGPTRLHMGPGRILLVCGPSGSGKSTTLDSVASHFKRSIIVNRLLVPPQEAVLDAVSPQAGLGDAIDFLTAAGLGDATVWLRPFEGLSDGEAFRARLALGMALQSRTPEPPPLFCDEFGSLFDHRSARAVSHALRKLVTRRRLNVVLATLHADLIPDIQPDAVLWLRGQGRWNYEEMPPPVTRPVSFLRRVHLEPGSKRDYEEFADSHYRAADELGFVDKVFVLRDGEGGEALGIVVYAFSPLELAIRNQATGGRFSGNPRRINRELRILRRLVIRPEVRGCGLGQYLVRRTLPKVGTEFVECLAAMGEFNPVFERSGMRRVGQIGLSPERSAALAEMEGLGVDIACDDFPHRVAGDAQVRQIVMHAVGQWYAATTGGGRRRVERQSPEFLARTFRGLAFLRPVYYLWQRTNRRRGTS